MRRTPWKPGLAAHHSGRVVVSVTDFAVTDWRDLPRVWLTGLRLRRAWPKVEGALGLWLWTEPLRLRSGSISVWRSEEDLRRFVRWPVHVAIMRRYRNRGSLSSATWEADHFAPGTVWKQAERRLRSNRGVGGAAP